MQTERGLLREIQVASIQPVDRPQAAEILPSPLLPWELQARFLGRPITLLELEALGAHRRGGQYIYTHDGREYILNLQP